MARTNTSCDGPAGSVAMTDGLGPASPPPAAAPEKHRLDRGPAPTLAPPAEAAPHGVAVLARSRTTGTLARFMARFQQPPMRYQNSYVWLLLAASLDIMLTWIVLYFGGEEVNWLADRVIQTHGLRGIVGYKFVLVVFVILMCEFVGRLRDQTGRRLAFWAVVINFFPVVWTLTQLTYVSLVGEPPSNGSPG